MLRGSLESWEQFELNLTQFHWFHAVTETEIEESKWCIEIKSWISRQHLQTDRKFDAKLSPSWIDRSLARLPSTVNRYTNWICKTNNQINYSSVGFGNQPACLAVLSQTEPNRVELKREGLIMKASDDCQIRVLWSRPSFEHALHRIASHRMPSGFNETKWNIK